MTEPRLVMRIEQFAEVVGGGTPSRKNAEYFCGDVPWITPRDLAGYQYRYISSGATNLTKLGLKKSSARLLPTEAVLFSSRAPIGYVALARNPLATNQGFRSLVCDRQKALPSFIYYALKYHSPAIEKLASGTTFREISGGVLKRFEMPLPPLAIQNKIASVLSAYDDLIENNLRRIKILEEMAQLLYREWFINFRFPGHDKSGTVDSPMGRIPRGWEALPVKALVNRISPGQLYDQKSVDNEGSIPVLDQGQSGIIGYHNGDPGVQADEDYPVIVFANHTCYQRIIAFPFSAIQNVIPFYPSSTTSRDIYWLHYATKDLISFNDYKGHWPEYMSKQALVPPFDLTKEFGGAVKPMIIMVFKLRAINYILRQTRDLLLPKLISGQLDVTDLNIKISEDLG